MQTSVPLNLDLQYKEVAPNESDSLFVFLHGYSQDMSFLYNYYNKDCKKLGHHSVFLQAPFPLVGRFPLDTTPDKKKLLSGYAWYFYDASTEEYLIPYTTPVSWIKNFLEQQFSNKTNIVIIGYSQGGYLAPFLAEQLTNIKKIIGINCSFRYDLLEKFECPEVYQLQGQADVIVTPELSQERFGEFQSKYQFKGSFQMLEDETHKLTTSLKKISLEYF